MRTHGLSRTPEYKSWCKMVERCTNPNFDHYDRYGGRGITICNRWRGSFMAFLADMGRKPTPKHELDRVDNDGNYEPGNCRWATRTQQSRNRNMCRRVTIGGVTRNVSEWAELAGLSQSTLLVRVKSGWSEADLLSPLVARGHTRRSR